MNELMLILISEGYTLKDLLHALANWTSEYPQFDEVLGHLEKATRSVALDEVCERINQAVEYLKKEQK